MSALEQALLHSLKTGNIQDVVRIVEFYRGGPLLNRIQDHNQSTPIHLAIKTCNVELLRYVLSVTDKKHINDKERGVCGGFTALHHACEIGSIDMIHILVSYGAAMNIRSGGVSGETPLIFCCKKGILKCANKLIELGADPKVTDNFGYNPAFWCRQFNHEDYISKLRLESPKIPSFNEYLGIIKVKDVEQLRKTLAKNKKKPKSVKGDKAIGGSSLKTKKKKKGK